MRDLTGSDNAGASMAMETDRRSLDEKLIAAHAADQKPVLVALYAEAGDQMAATGDIDAACFYWTHARVFALELGATRAETLRQRLMAEGREA